MSAADLFENPLSVDDEDLANAVRTSTVVFVGELKRIEVRYKPVDDIGQNVPCLCVEVAVLSPVPHTVRAEQKFATHKEAEQAASHFTKGQRVSVASPLLGMRVYLPQAEVQPAAMEPTA
jgi:hypothetical protein